MTPTSLPSRDEARILSAAGAPLAMRSADLADRPAPSRRHLNSPPSPAIALSRAAAAALAENETFEVRSLLAVAACALAALAIAASQVEQSISAWPVFEQFVRAVLV